MRMNGHGLSARIYIAALAVATLGLAAVALANASLPDPERGILAAVLAGLTAVAFSFQLPFGAKLKLSLGTSVIFTAILLLEPGIAMLVVGIGTLTAYILRGRDWDEVTFNSAQTALQAGVGGLLLASAGWDVDNLLLNRPSQAPAVLVAALAMYLLNTVLVATIVGLQLGTSPLPIWRQALASDRTQELGQFALGFLAAVVAAVWVWALPLFLVPLFVLYRSLVAQQRLEQRRESLVAEVERALESRSQLIALTLRELEVPITVMDGYTQLLSRTAERVVDDQMLRRLGAIHRQVGRLSILVDRLIRVRDLERDTAGLELLPFDLAIALAEVVNEVKTIIPGVELQLQGQAQGVWVRGDAMWIELALRTLLLDAVQRSGPREGADIRIRMVDGRAVVEIASRGVETRVLDARGVSETHSIGQRIAATGLGDPGTGLYISKLIAERHGGEIGSAPEDSGEGRFYFSLPAMAEGSTARGEATPASSRSDR